MGATTVHVTQACNAVGLQKCLSDFSAATGASANMAARCAAVETYETCFASNSDGCSAHMTGALTSQMNSAKAQLNCATNPGTSASNSDDGEAKSSNVVTMACDATGLQQCVAAFSTGVAGATDMAAKCKFLNTYNNCLVAKSAGCSEAQKNAFVGPVESAKSSLKCDEEDLSSNAPLMRPCAFAVFVLSAMLAVASVW